MDSQQVLTYMGRISDEGLLELQRLFLHRPWIHKLVYLALGLCAVILALYIALDQNHPQRAAVSMAVLAVGALMVFLGLFGPEVGFRFWRKQVVEGECAGELHPEGVLVPQTSWSAPWTLFIAAKMSSEAAILYLSKTEGLPLHRELFSSDSEWEFARKRIVQSIKRVITI